MTSEFKEVTLADLMAQRISLATPVDEIELMTESEAEALLASATPGSAKTSFNLVASSDSFAPSGRRYIAPIIKKNGEISTARQITALTNRHLAIMDFILANPRASMIEVAAEFGVTQAWLSTVKNSDLWRITYEERRNLIEEHQRIVISDQLTSIVAKGLGCLEDAIDDPDTTLASKLQITKMALEHSGFSNAKPSVSIKVDNSTTNNVVQLDESKQAAIAAARARVLAKATQQHARLAEVVINAKPE